MSIVPASCLSASDLALLGNNLLPPVRRPRPRSRHDLDAVNRSLAAHGEQVGRLYSVSSVAAAAFASRPTAPVA